MFVARPQEAREAGAGTVAIDRQDAPADGVGEHSIPARRATGEAPRGVGVDGCAAREDGGLGGAARERQRGHRDLHDRANRPQGARAVARDGGVCPRAGGEQHVGEDVGAQLVGRALVARGRRLGGGGRARVSYACGLLRQAVVDAVREDRGKRGDELGHAVGERHHDDAAGLACLVVALLQGARLKLLGRALEQRAEAAGGMAFGACRGEPIEARADVASERRRGLEDDVHMALRGPALAQRREREREVVDEGQGARHAALHRAVGHPHRARELGGEGAHLHLALLRPCRAAGSLLVCQPGGIRQCLCFGRLRRGERAACGDDPVADVGDARDIALVPPLGEGGVRLHDPMLTCTSDIAAGRLSTGSEAVHGAVAVS